MKTMICKVMLQNIRWVSIKHSEEMDGLNLHIMELVTLNELNNWKC